MSEAIMEAIKVHITGSDVPTPSAPTRKDMHTSFMSASVAKVVIDGQPRLLLPHAPNRHRANLIVTGTAGDTAILAGSQGEASNGGGTLIGPLAAPIVIEGTDELWLGVNPLSVGQTIVVGIISEFY